jgi:acyl phosphate:glycerol-3-phosphate acyltransferase
MAWQQTLGGDRVILSQGGLVLAAYLAGSLPTGYWLGRAWKGLDVRAQGSGNLGATNVFRVLGPGPGLATLLIDILKGFFPVWICQRLFPNDLALAMATGLTAILGHTWSIFVRFRGGKGVATAAGVFAALSPIPCVIAFLVFVAVFSVTRLVSLGSLLGVLALTASSFAFRVPRSLAWTTVAVSLFVVWTHRQNIRRLWRGTENRLRWPPSPA